MAKRQGKAATNKSAIAPVLPRACADEAAAVEFFENQRWSGQPHCPHCEATVVYKMTDRATGRRNKRFLWRCENCEKQFTVRVGTVFEDSRIPLRHWACGFWAAAASKKGVSARQIQRMTGLHYKSALFLMHRTRLAMVDHSNALPKLRGTAEADETHIRGKPRHKQPHKGTAKSWLSRRTTVVVLVERGGKVRSFVRAEVAAANLSKILLENVNRESHLMTDSSPVYARSGRPFARHSMTNHQPGEYAKPDGTRSNTIEFALSGLKRGINGTFHNVSRKHLQRYVADSIFGGTHAGRTTVPQLRLRFAEAKASDYAIVGQSAKPLRP